jgi:hypothetical protein
VATTRVSNKGTVTVRPSKPVVADAAMKAAVRTVATNRLAAKELTKDADAARDYITGEVWDRTLDSRQVIDEHGTVLAEVLTVTNTSKKLDVFVEAFQDKLPDLWKSIEGDESMLAAWHAAIAAATSVTTYPKVLPK